MTDNLRALGESAVANKALYQYDKPDPSILDFITAPDIYRPSIVDILAQEFTCLCPMTGQPDMGQLRIVYEPITHYIESKSLKLYLGMYRQFGTFHEQAVERVATDLCSERLDWVIVQGIFAPRGGIAIRPCSWIGEVPRYIHEALLR